MEHVCENCGTIFEGAPQARFHDDACRKAYAREQAETARLFAERRRVYIEEAVRGARLDAESRAYERVISMTQVKDLEPVDVEARVERARAYAVWRWDGFHAGEVGSL